MFLYPILFFIFGLMVAGVVWGVLGFIIVGGIGLTIYNVVALIMGYAKAASGTRRLQSA